MLARLKSYIGEVSVPSAIEVSTLVTWFVFVLRGMRVEAVGILFIGLLLEHLAAQLIYSKYKKLNPVPWAINSAIETVVWVGWLGLHLAKQDIAAFAVLYVGLLFEHTVSENILEGRGIFSRLISKNVIEFTAIEVVNSYVLLHVMIFKAIAVLGMLVLSLVEHALQFLVADERG